MEPVILIHGFSAESRDPNSPGDSYGDLPSQVAALLKAQGAEVVDVNISRYISLDDGVGLDDVSLALDRALHDPAYARMLEHGFNAIIHSTGALVVRNWVRRCTEPGKADGRYRCPLRRIIHLAGANLGSGWAHIGETQLVKWLRFIGHGGEARGLAVLDGLELGSNWTIDLHRHFLQAGQDMFRDYGVMEFSIVGTQAPPEWMIVPFRYGKEDGSDGVVRVSASNLNFNYLRIGSAQSLSNVNWEVAREFAGDAFAASTSGRAHDFTEEHPLFGGGFYGLREASIPGEVALPEQAPRQRIPFAIPYNCAHSTESRGIVDGKETRAEVLPLIDRALQCSAETYPSLVEPFAARTRATYDQVREGADTHIHGLKGFFVQAERSIEHFLDNPLGQYDPHAQLIVRVRDQHGQPVRNCSVHFNSFGGGEQPQVLIDELFEDVHVNNNAKNTFTFYLRLERWDGHSWKQRLPDIKGVDLEIDSIDLDTQRIVFIPLRMRLPSEMLMQWLRPHETTIIDVELIRLPSPDSFVLRNGLPQL